MKFSKEMIEKAKNATSAAELFEMAKAAGIELSMEDAEMYFSFLSKDPQLLSDEELDRVAGGKGEKRPDPKYKPGQRVVFWVSKGNPLYGWITESYWVEFQKAYYYWVGMDNGEKMKFPLESEACVAKVIS